MIKKCISILAVSIFCFCIAASSGEAASLTTYRDKEIRIMFQLPSDWKQSRKEGEQRVGMVAYPKTIEGDTPDVALLLLYGDPLTEEMGSLGKFPLDLMDAAALNQFAEMVISSEDQFTLQDPQYIVLSDGHRALEAWAYRDGEMVAYFLVTTKQSQILVLVGMAENQAKFTENQELLINCVRSVKIGF